MASKKSVTYDLMVKIGKGFQSLSKWQRGMTKAKSKAIMLGKIRTPPLYAVKKVSGRITAKRRL